MSFGSKLKRGLRHYLSLKAARKKLGLTGGSRHFRQLKRSFRSARSIFESPMTSASTVGYQHQGRTLSQLTGGV